VSAAKQWDECGNGLSGGGDLTEAANAKVSLMKLKAALITRSIHLVSHLTCLIEISARSGARSRDYLRLRQIN
jgi:hypothetical protein